ncbi:hypothetical protein [Stenotrophomonas bentonitica]
MRAVLDGSELYLFGNASVQRFTLHDPVSETGHAVASTGSLVAPVPGRIVATLLAPSTQVVRGGTVQGYRLETADRSPTAGRWWISKFLRDIQLRRGISDRPGDFR